ncbi:trehalose utilization protein ThuA [soil metagenome]
MIGGALNRIFARCCIVGFTIPVLGPTDFLPSATAQESPPIRVRVWCEGTAPASIYPEGINGALAEGLDRHPGLIVQRARLDDESAGLTDAALDATDVLVWWSRYRHEEVPDDRVEAIAERVRAGRLGFVALHASCQSKPFLTLMKGPCELGGWRDDGRPETIAVALPGHPIARGVNPFTLPRSSMYSEPFAVPEPEDVVFVSHWGDGQSFRSGMTWTVDQGRVAYFHPGHDQFPILFHPQVRQIITNAVLWSSPRALSPTLADREPADSSGQGG